MSIRNVMFLYGKVNEDIIRILNDPGVPLGIPQKLKAHSISTNSNPFAAAQKVQCEQSAPLPDAVESSSTALRVEPQDQVQPVIATQSPAELNMQNLAIHQTLMNEASAMTAKQQIMRNYMILSDEEAATASREM